MLTPKADDESHSYQHLQVVMSDRFAGTERDKGTQLQRPFPLSRCTRHPGLAAADAAADSEGSWRRDAAPL